jgi:hypothetical protein
MLLFRHGFPYIDARFSHITSADHIFASRESKQYEMNVYKHFVC